MVHYEGGATMELGYFLGGVVSRTQKPRGFHKENLSAELKNNIYFLGIEKAVNHYRLTA